MLRRWIEAILQGLLVVVLVALLPGAAVTYLAHINSVWEWPVLQGLAAAALVSIVAVAIKAMMRLPPKRVIVDTNNVEPNVREWLNTFRVGVRNEPTPEAFFRVAATMDSRAVMSICRPRGEFSDYLIVRSDITPTEDEMRLLNAMTPREVARIVLTLRLELARFKVGHSALVVPLEPFNVFKRIPINDSLTDHTLMMAIEEVECALHSIAAVWLLALQPNNPTAIKALTPQAH